MHLTTTISLSFLASHVSAACSRETLEAITSDYLTAQTTGNTTFSSLSPNTTYTENRKPHAFNTSILSHALEFDHYRTQHDAPQCAAFAELIVTTPSHPYVIATQLRVSNTTLKITNIDSIVTSTGDWLFNASSTLAWASLEFWTPLPAAARSSRAVLLAAANAYCDVFDNKTVVVPWGQPCARLEGGMYTGNGSASDSCDVGIPSNVKLVNRQFVVDEEYGTVDVMMDFAGKEGSFGAAGLPDSHEFRIEGGRLRYVHTVTSCGGKSCM